MHHAELIVDTFENASEYMRQHVALEGPDVSYLEKPQLSIDDVRSIRIAASVRPVKESHRVFVLSFQRATIEAQNALLKLLEEPVSTTRFYIVVPYEDVLIQTVLSRLMRTRHEGGVTYEVNEPAQSFVGASYAERLLLVAERAKAKDIQWFHTIIDGLEVWAHKHTNASVMEDIVRTREYIDSRGASLKMLFEHLALTVPSPAS